MKASDPRDKIYGLLAFTEGLSADCSKTIRNLYVGFTESYIGSVGKLHFLTEAGTGIQENLINTVRDLSSWAPDWYARLQYVQADKTDDKSRFTVYEASKGMEAGSLTRLKCHPHWPLLLGLQQANTAARTLPLQYSYSGRQEKSMDLYRAKE